MNIYYHVPNDKAERIVVFPNNEEKGFSLFRRGRGLPYTKDEVKRMGGQPINRGKAMRIVGSKSILSVEI